MGNLPCSSCQRAIPEIGSHGDKPTGGVVHNTDCWDCGAHPVTSSRGSRAYSPGMGPDQGSRHKEKAAGPTAFQQLQRVESRDEEAFARQTEVAKRLIAALSQHRGKSVDIAEALSFTSMKSRRASLGTLKSLTHEPSSGRLSLEFPITARTAETYRNHLIRFGNRKLLDSDTADELLEAFVDKMKEIRSKAVAQVPMPSEKGGVPSKLTVVGDTHGQLQDVLHIFHEYGVPSAQNVYVFNGDIADRGDNSCEIFFLLAMYFLADPSSVYMNRGNHENEEMNAMDSDCGGGFFEEACHKYGPNMYWQFVDLMKTLPLCSVIGEKVFVVHAGLTRFTNLRIDFINNIEHTEFTIPDLDSEKMEDLVWVDLVWSDPVDVNGLKPSHRGVGYLFGPDITEKFCRDNAPIEMVIRSHQLPSDQKGYMYQKGQRCVTIFSASNYCGDSGNQGAVLVFDSSTFPQYRVYEHYAPPLDAMAGLMQSAPKEWRDAGKALKEQQQQSQERTWKEKELNKMMVRIVEDKPRIWSKFLDKTGGIPLIDFKMFVDILSAVIGETWSWEVAWKTWHQGNANVLMNFKYFLQRFAVVVSQDELVALKFKMITSVYESILHSHGTLEETLKLFDKDGDGTVGMSEMREVLRTVDVGLSVSQIDSMLHTLFEVPADSQRVPQIPIQDFLGRFCMVYKSAESALAGRSSAPEKRLGLEALSLIGHHVSRMSYKELGLQEPALASAKARVLSYDREASSDKHTEVAPCTRKGVKAKTKKVTLTKEGQKGLQSNMTSMRSSMGATADEGEKVALKFEGLFMRMDEDKSGIVSHEEFVNGVKKLPGISKLKLSNGKAINDDVIRSLPRIIDKEGDGISILELLVSFSFEDTGGSGMSDSLCEHILAVLFRHRQAVRIGVRLFDPEATGVVHKSDFQMVLECLNSATGDEESQLLKPQILRLCEALSNDDEKIPYEDFFDSFQVSDSESDRAVKLGKRKKEGVS